MGVGMPQHLLLCEFGEYVKMAFGHIPYQVGSSITYKEGWRDVDVRVMLTPAEYEPYGDPRYPHQNRKWTAMVTAWSSFGRQLTASLPIDFQIQQIDHANETEKGHPRSALFRVSECLTPRESGHFNLFKEIEGLEKVNPADFVEFEREMKERVIPEIVAVVKRRHELAEVSNRRPL